MTYKDINTKLSQLEARDEAVSREIEVACSKIDSIAKCFSLMSSTIDKFGNRCGSCGPSEQ